MADNDYVIDFGDRRIRIPKNIAGGVPWLRTMAFGRRPRDDATVLAIVTTEPTAEDIATSGEERVATFAVLLTPADVRKLIDDLQRHAEGLPPP